jgi:transposase
MESDREKEVDMNTPDARHLTIETQEYLRQQAIRLCLQGKHLKDIGEYLGVHRNTVSKWWWQYEHAGEAGLYQQARGRQVGEGRILSPEDEEEVQAAMTGHFPEEHGIDSALWTRRAVQSYRSDVWGAVTDSDGWGIPEAMGIQSSKASRAGL